MLRDACKAGVKLAFPDVKLPQSVKVKNQRLAFFFRLLQLAAVCLVASILISGRTFYKVEEPFGSVAQWIDRPEAAYRAQVQDDLTQDFCTNPGKYDYVYSDEWRYTGFRCTEVPRSDRTRKTENGLYVPTSFTEFRERRVPLPENASEDDPDACDALEEECSIGWEKVDIVHGHSGAVSVCECQSTDNWFIVGTDSYKISVEHYYEMVRVTTGELESRQHSKTKCSADGWKCMQEGEQLKTIVVVETDSESHRVNMSFESPTAISLDLGSILSAAGMDLDKLNEDTVANLQRCDSEGSDPSTCDDDAQKYPLLRITGAEVRISMRYYNNHFKPDYEELADHNGPSCVATLRVIPKWSGLPVVDCAKPTVMSSLESDCTTRYYYGVKISFETAGRFGFIDIMQLLLTIGATISYFSIPSFIIYFLALYFLGPLSQFYQSQCISELRADTAMTSFVAQSISAGTSFRVLTGTKDGLDREELLTEIHRAFKHKESSGLGLTEQAHLAELVWDRLATKPTAEGRSSQAPSSQDDAEMRIRLNEFVQTLAPNRLSDNMGSLFNKSRCKNPLEVVFTPSGQFKAKKTFKRTETGNIDAATLNRSIEHTTERSLSQSRTEQEPTLGDLANAGGRWFMNAIGAGGAGANGANSANGGAGGQAGGNQARRPEIRL